MARELFYKGNNMQEKSINYSTIEWLRFFCACAVVLLHNIGKPIEGTSFISYQNGAFDIIRIFFSRGICWVAVPIFFIISGYLFFSKLEEWNSDIYKNKIKRRVTSLMIPYLIWNLMPLLVVLSLQLIKSIITGNFNVLTTLNEVGEGGGIIYFLGYREWMAFKCSRWVPLNFASTN